MKPKDFAAIRARAISESDRGEWDSAHADRLALLEALSLARNPQEKTMKDADPEVRDVMAVVAMFAIILKNTNIRVEDVGPLAYDTADSMLEARATSHAENIKSQLSR